VEPAHAAQCAARPGDAALVQVCHVDESIQARVGGHVLIDHPYGPKRRLIEVRGPERSALCTIGVRGGSAVLRDPAIFVDVFYTDHPNEHAVHDRFTLGPRQYFVLGDNSVNSNDSRKWGIVPEDYLIGEAFLVLWPLGRMKLVR
jgi:hypothetical protein